MKITETLTLNHGKVNGNLVEGVKVLGLESKNGRTYLKEAVSKALPMYEGKWVYIDHALSDKLSPPGYPKPPRSVTEKFARIVNARIDETGGIRSDLRFNLRHPFAETFLGWLETDSSAIGLSHSVEGLVKKDNRTGKDIVHEISDVESVDLVSEPATTQGLYENVATNSLMMSMKPDESGYAAKVGEVIQAIMMDASLDGKSKKAKVLTLLNLMDDEVPAEEMPKEGEEEKPKEGDGEKDEEIPAEEAKDADKPDEEEEGDEMEKKVEAAIKRLDDYITEALKKLDQKLKLTEDKKPISLPPANPKTGKAISVDDFVSNLTKGK